MVSKRAKQGTKQAKKRRANDNAGGPKKKARTNVKNRPNLIGKLQENFKKLDMTPRTKKRFLKNQRAEIEIHFLKKKTVWKGNVPEYNTLVNHMERTLSIPPSVPKPYKWLCKIPERGTFRVIADKKTYEKNAEFFMSKCQLATLLYSVEIKHFGDSLESGLSWGEVQKNMEKLLKDEEMQYWSVQFEGEFISLEHQYYDLLWSRKHKKKNLVLSLRKHKQDRYRYFKMHSGVVKTSELTVEEGLGSDYLLDHKSFDRYLRKAQKETHPERQKILQKARQDFNKWLLSLYFNHNLLFYGVGSKKKLLQEFFTTTLSFGRRFIVNGYHPACSMREMIRTIIAKIGVKSQNSQIYQLLKALRLHLNKKKQRHVFILVNNIEGPGFRSNENQTLLARLAEIEKIHLVASMDHIHAVSLWDPHLESRFRFRRVKISTYESYDLESHVNRTAIITANKEQRVDGIRHVLKSLTPNHRELLETLAEILVEQERIEDDEGVKFEEFFKACYDSMLVGNDADFRALTAELVDHELINIRSLQNGDDIYTIPYTREVIEAHILQ